MNGINNPARPFAISAMIILCASLTAFFFQFATVLEKDKTWQCIIRLFGTLSMLSAALIFTKFHDTLTTVSSVFGVVVVLRMIRTIYNSQLQLFKISGITCIVLLMVNNFIYYSEYYIEHLPFIQKITFALVLAWIVALNVDLFKRGLISTRSS